MRHALWVRLCHWLLALSVFTLAYSGFYILLVHPRLYWGEVGNDLTPAWLELPLNDNHNPEGWQQTVTFESLANQPISASRTIDIFNENGWARSLHFLAGWFLVVGGAIYFALGLITRHISRDLLPRPRPPSQQPESGHASSYTLLQRSAYIAIAFVVLPFTTLAGLAMSPRITASFPVLLDVFGGHQSARTLHFFGFVVLLAFVVVHLARVALTGFGRHMRAMTLGR